MSEKPPQPSESPEQLPDPQAEIIKSADVESDWTRYEPGNPDNKHKALYSLTLISSSFDDLRPLVDAIAAEYPGKVQVGSEFASYPSGDKNDQRQRRGMRLFVPESLKPAVERELQQLLGKPVKG